MRCEREKALPGQAGGSVPVQGGGDGGGALLGGRGLDGRVPASRDGVVGQRTISFCRRSVVHHPMCVVSLNKGGADDENVGMQDESFVAVPLLATR